MNDHIPLDLYRQHVADETNMRREVHGTARIARQFGRFAGRAVSVLVFATLAVLEPLVRFVLVSLAILGIFVTTLFGFLIDAPGFPKWLMLAMSLGCFLILVGYHGVMTVFGSVCSKVN